MKKKHLFLATIFVMVLPLLAACNILNNQDPQNDTTTPPPQNTEPAITAPETTTPDGTGTDARQTELDLKVVEGKLNGLIDGNSFEFTPKQGDIMVFRYSDATSNFDKLGIEDNENLRVQYYHDGVSNIAINVQKI